MGGRGGHAGIIFALVPEVRYSEQFSAKGGKAGQRVKTPTRGARDDHHLCQDPPNVCYIWHNLQGTNESFAA